MNIFKNKQNNFFKMNRIVLCVVLSWLMVMVSCNPVEPDIVGLVKVFVANGDAGDEVGRSVSISGDTAIVSAHQDDSRGYNSGSAYIFVRNGNNWFQQGRLIPSDGAARNYFGISVAIDGDTVIVGAYREGYSVNGGASSVTEGSGSAYVFTRSGTTWTQQAKILPTDPGAGEEFGYSVAIAGNTAIVGCWEDADNGNFSGSAYVFTRSGTNWTQQAKILPTDGNTGDKFGVSVAINGDTVIVGAFEDDDNSGSGSAYIFTRSGTTWTQQAKILPTGGSANDRFGVSVAVNGDTAIVGANEENGKSGSAYIFTRSGATWTQATKINSTDAANGDSFGISTAIKGDIALVGANKKDANGIDSGSAYVFTRSEGNSWTEQVKILPTDLTNGDNFGISVALDGSNAVVGSFFDDENGINSGSTYIYHISR